ncbi:MAG: hypothetical protein IT370_03040 [Deltaproteobacteria bacterium]|nr:hypothetical protein [Deltaproteobacteria bacterium]
MPRVIALILLLVAARAEARLVIKARGELREDGPVLVLTVKNLGAATWLPCSYDQFTQYGSVVGRRLRWGGGMSRHQLALCGGRRYQVHIGRGETHELAVRLQRLAEGSAADTAVTWMGARVRVVQRGPTGLRVGRVRDL